MNKVLRMIILFGLTTIGFNFAQAAEVASYQLSSHVLDISRGQPAKNVRIVLSKQQNNTDSESWLKVAEGVTNNDGRVQNFLPLLSGVSNVGVYKLTFYTAPYFKANNQTTFYPYIEVIFKIEGDQHYHVPITLSPFGYSTYRGS